MKNHIPTTPEFRAAFMPLMEAAKLAKERADEAERGKCILIQGYLLGHGVSEGSWEILPDGSAVVLTQPKQEQTPETA